MGSLLSLLSRDESNCCSYQKYDVFLDFENAQPTPDERLVYMEVQSVLEQCDIILDEIQCYKGAGKEIREAITTPTEECQLRAWKTVMPLVAKLKRFYLFSTDLERIVPMILGELCSGNSTPTQHLDSQQALVKQFAEILEFVLKFDEYKMKTPAIQNDFSYYRRTITRQRMCDNEFSRRDGKEVSNELANRMSLFYAHATPMLRALSDATSKFVCENPEIPIEQTTEMLSTMTKVCLRMLENPSLISQFEREETRLLVLRVMVGLVILYDHVHPQGVFVKGNGVDVKGCIKLLKEQPSVRSEGLLNALRYTTKHFNEESTPKYVRNLLAA
nr:PREDICTED: protein FAM49B-like [Bemisia tabaci]